MHICMYYVLCTIHRYSTFILAFVKSEGKKMNIDEDNAITDTTPLINSSRTSDAQQYCSPIGNKRARDKQRDPSMWTPPQI